MKSCKIATTKNKLNTDFIFQYQSENMDSTCEHQSEVHSGMDIEIKKRIKDGTIIQL